MRMIRWLIPFVVLMSTLLACFATTPDDDDSSVPMTRQTGTVVNFDDNITYATPTGSTPVPFRTTDPASFGPSTTPNSEDGGGGVSVLLVLAIVMVLLLGAFAAVIQKNPRRSTPKE